MSFFEAQKRKREDRRRIEAAKLTLRDVERALKKSKTPVSADIRATIDAEVKQVRAAVSARDAQAAEQGQKTLEELGARHLTGYRKSASSEYFESIGFAILVALSLRAFVIEPFRIPSGSMIPTLEIGDHIFVNKFSYGLRVPFTFVKFAQFSEPKRGEVIVFIYPLDHSQDYIKRVVGLPGDTVEVRDGQVFVNNVAMPRQAVPGDCRYLDRDRGNGDWETKRCVAYREQLDEHDHVAIQAPALENRRGNAGPYKVKPNHVFVMGDNRDNSSDSRVWGQVPYENIKGRAMFIWWTWTKGGPNTRRMFTKIE